MVVKNTVTFQSDATAQLVLSQQLVYPSLSVQCQCKFQQHTHTQTNNTVLFLWH